MPSSPPADRLVSALARVLSPRGALTLHRVDGNLIFALRAALAVALPSLPLVLTGRSGLAVYVILGAFTTTFGRNLPYPRRARALALVAVAMTGCVGCGSLLAVGADPQAGGAGAVAVVAATAVVAGLAKLVCDATRLGGLGAVLLLFSFAVAANGSPTLAEVPQHTPLAAAGAAVAWLLAMAGRLWHPDRPQRLAVAAALRELAELLDAAGPPVGGRARHRATGAVLQAYRSLDLAPPTAAGGSARGGVCVRLTDLSWSLLISSARRWPDEPAVLAGQLRRQVRLLVDRRSRLPLLLPELSLPGLSLPSTATGAGPLPADRVAELVGGGRRRAAALLVPALRMALGTAVAGGLALALHLGHGYWAAISAAAVLHSVNVRTTAQRAVQRTLGTFVGLLVAVGVIALHPGPAALVGVIILLEFLLEYVVARNYGLGIVFLTPMALLLSELVVPTPAGLLVRERALASVLGIAVGLVCALLVVHDHAAVRAERALAGCSDAAEEAERALGGGPGPSVAVVQLQLAAAVVELHDADDAASGELWPAGVDPAELAAAEQRAYLLLERLVPGD